jgi:large subunit ribosomal protein L22
MADLQVHARAMGLRIAPRKMGLVAGLVRGRSVSDALTILSHTPKKAAQMLGKVISSAAANASHNYRADASKLMLAEVQIGHGPRARRYFTAARGQAHPYMKRTSHVHIVVSAPMPDKAAATSRTSSSTSSARVATTKKEKE